MWIVVERTGRSWHAVATRAQAERVAGADASACTPERARFLVARLGSDPTSAPRLRRLLAECGTRYAAGFAHLHDGAVHRELMRLVAQKTVQVLERGRERAPFVGTRGEAENRPEDLPRTTASITYQLLDDASDEPIAGVTLLITLPDGSEVTRKTNGEGLVQIDGLRAGRCGVRAELGGQDLLHVLAFVGFGQHPYHAGEDTHARQPWKRPTVAALEPVGMRAPKGKPLAIADVTTHRVRTGETLDSIAALYELDTDALTAFNFGTTDHDEVQRLLGDELGCAHRDFATGDYVLSSRDQPGLLYIPKPWQRFGQATDREWLIRVRRIRPTPPPYVFSM